MVYIVVDLLRSYLVSGIWKIIESLDSDSFPSLSIYFRQIPGIFRGMLNVSITTTIVTIFISVALLSFSSASTSAQNSSAKTSAAASKCINYNIYTNTITVTCNANLSQIERAINDKSVLEKDPHGVWILNAIVKVNPHAKLTINHSDTSWLKITNKILQESEPNFISISGNAIFDGVKITSWDPFSNHVITQNVNGSIARPYIIIDKGNANISNSELAFLGFASNSSRSGLSYQHGGGNGSRILNNSFHDMWDGFYSYSAGFITIKDNKYYNNLRNGIYPHAESHDLSFIGNIAYNNSNIGAICSERCYNVLFDSNMIHNNKEAGLMFSVGTNNSTATKNYAYNEKTGISIFQSSNDKVYNNQVKSNHIGIQIAQNSSGNHVYNNTMTNNTFGFYFADNQPKNNLFENNHLNNIPYPIKLNGINNIGRNNTIYNNK